MVTITRGLIRFLEKLAPNYGQCMLVWGMWDIHLYMYVSKYWLLIPGFKYLRK